MVGEPPDPAARDLRQAEPRDAFEEAALAALASCHQLCLPHTASSRAGLSVLRAMYATLARQAAADVIWRPGAGERRHLGAFAAGTARLRETEAAIRRGLSGAAFLRLGLRVASMPMHVLARRRWEHTIPDSGIGYVLTLGSARAMVGGDGPRGSDVLRELEARFVARGLGESWVDTELSNGRAIAFYLRMGYVEVSRDFGQVLLKKPLPRPDERDVAQ